MATSLSLWCIGMPFELDRSVASSLSLCYSCVVLYNERIGDVCIMNG